MRNIITLILLLSLYSCKGPATEAITDSAAVLVNEVSPTNNIIGIPIKIGGLEIAQSDFPNETFQHGYISSDGSYSNWWLQF